MNGKNKLTLFLYILLTICTPWLGIAKNELAFDELAFVCETDMGKMEESLNQGTRSILLKIEEEQGKYYTLNPDGEKFALLQILSQMKGFLHSNQEAIIILIIQSPVERIRIEKELIKSFSDQLLLHNSLENWPDMSMLSARKIQIVAVWGDDIASTSMNKIRNERRYADRFSSDPLDKMILFHSEESSESALLKDCYDAWSTTGKAPNFISAPLIKWEDTKRVAETLNKTRRFKGIISYKDTLLNEIHWKHSPGVITPAKFSFPLLLFDNIFTPYKNGYRISPGEVIHNKAMEDVPRMFTAFDMSLDEKLVHHFQFEGDFSNQVEPEWKGSISKDVTFKKDQERGEVLHLSQQDSYIDYAKENSLDFNIPITVAAWIKPDRVTEYMGIMGFGTSFSLKLNDGKPDFTTATIKDHLLDRTLDMDQWHHLAVVFNPNYLVQIYINGEIAGKILTSEINPSKHSLVIGNNVWGEQFFGSIDDLRIWNRGLSGEEISGLYQMKPEAGKPYWIGGILALALILGYFLVRKNKKVLPASLVEDVVYEKEETSEMSEILQISDIPDDVLPKEITPEIEKISQNQIRLFGNFCVVSEEKGDISSGFSPLLRQILSFFILNTEKNKGGININKLTNTFWPGVPKDKAKENRGANIKKLRKVLNDVDGVKIVYRDKKWHVETNSDLFVDMIEYNKVRELLEVCISKNEIDIQVLNKFLDILKPGNILQNINAEWLDEFKSIITEEVVDILSRIYADHKKLCSVEVRIRMAKTILLFDSLSEEALKILIRETVAAGKHGVAKSEYERFAKNYKTLYGDSYPVDFQEIIT